LELQIGSVDGFARKAKTVHLSFVYLCHIQQKYHKNYGQIILQLQLCNTVPTPPPRSLVGQTLHQDNLHTKLNSCCRASHEH